MHICSLKQATSLLESNDRDRNIFISKTIQHLLGAAIYSYLGSLGIKMKKNILILQMIVKHIKIVL